MGRARMPDREDATAARQSRRRTRRDLPGLQEGDEEAALPARSSSASRQHDDVVAEPAAANPRGARPMQFRQRDSSPVRVTDLDVRQAALAGDAPQVLLYERRDVSGVKARRLLKRVKLTSRYEKQDARQAELIRRRQHDPPSWPHDPRHLAHESAWILEVLDRLDGDRRARGRAGQRVRRSIQIDLPEANGIRTRKPFVSDRVAADVRLVHAPKMPRAVPPSAPEIDEHVVRASLLPQG